MPDIRLSLAAQQDLRDIRIFSKRFGIAVAREYLLGMGETFTLLRTHPLAGAGQEDLGDGIRAFAFRSHRIYYRVDDDMVLVVRILHHAQDVMRHMPS